MTVRDYIAGEKLRTPAAQAEALEVFDRAVDALDALWDCSCPSRDGFAPVAAGEECERCKTMAALR